MAEPFLSVQKTKSLTFRTDVAVLVENILRIEFPLQILQAFVVVTVGHQNILFGAGA